MAEATSEQDQANSGKKSVLVLGGTGETGQCVMKELQCCDEVGKIIMINRRNVDLDGPAVQKIEQRVINFDAMDEHDKDFQGADVAICCLGTTIGAAGKAGMRKMYYDYMVNSAKKCKESGTCKEFHLLSAAGIKENSMFAAIRNFAERDAAIKEMGFDRAVFYMPRLLLSKRKTQGFNFGRTLEKMGNVVAKATDKSGKWSITVESLAKVIVHNAILKSSDDKVQKLEHADIINFFKPKE